MRSVTRGGREALYTPAMLMLILVVGISFMGLGFIMPLRALYGRELGASSVEIALMTSVFLLAGFVASPPMGWLADRFGYRRILWVGLLVHALLMLAYIPVQHPLLLIGLRGLEGIASASVLPPARALANVIAPRSRQGEALGVLSAAQAAGILLGPVAGSLLASQVGYTPSFFVASGSLVLAIAATLLLPGGARSAEYSEHSERDERGASPAKAPGAFKELFTPPLMLAYGLQLILQTTQGVIASIWVLYMADRGASLLEIGWSFTTFALPLIIFTPLTGRFSDRYGRYRITVLGVLLFGIVFCIYGLQLSPLWLIVLSTVEGASAAVVRGGLDGLLADVMPATAKGKVQSNFNAAGTFGSFLGATLAGVLYTFNMGMPFTAAGVLCLLTLALLFVPGVVRLFPRKQKLEG